MEMILWFGGMNGRSTFSIDVFPDAVPPATSIFSSYCMASHSIAAVSGESVFASRKCMIVHGERENFRIVSVFPSVEIGKSVAFTRSPVVRCASMSGARFVICLPTCLPTDDE